MSQWGILPPYYGQTGTWPLAGETPMTSDYGRRHEFVYLATDLYTEVPISELPMRGVSFSWKINSPGEFSGTVEVPAMPNVNQYFKATVPGRTALYVLRDGFPVWGGIIWKRTFGSSARELKIEADTWDSYMYHRILDEDWLFIRDMVTVPNRPGTEQIEIFRHLWRRMSKEDPVKPDPPWPDPIPPQTDPPTLGPHRNINVVLGEQVSNVQRGVYFKKWDFKTYGEHLEAFAKKVNGFEWLSSVGLSADGTKVERRIDFAHPKFGRTLDRSNLYWEYPAFTIEYEWVADSDKAATAAYVLGKGDGDLKTYLVRLNDEGLNKFGFLRLDQAYPHDTVFDKEILKSHAGKYLEAYAPPISSVTIKVHPRLPDALGQYFLGDEVRLIIDDDFFIHADVAETDLLVRIKGLTVSPNDDGLENVSPELAIVARDLEIVDEEDKENDLVPDGWNGATVDAPDIIPARSGDVLKSPASPADIRAQRLWTRGLRQRPPGVSDAQWWGAVEP